MSKINPMTLEERISLSNAKSAYRRLMRNTYTGWTKRSASRKCGELKNRINPAIG